MPNTGRLEPEQLCRPCATNEFAFETTDDLKDLVEVVGQDRAVEATRFGIGIRQPGYNLFLLGPQGLGKQTIVRRFLEQKAATEPAPSDWCYVNNFDEPQEPRALRLPTGLGTQFRGDVARLVEELAAQRRVVLVEAAPERRHRPRALLLDAAHLRAQVRRLEPDGDAARADKLQQRVRDLLADPLLHGEAPRVETHEPGQFGDAEDLLAGDVGDVGGAVEGDGVVFAEGEKGDRALDDLAMPAVHVPWAL